MQATRAGTDPIEQRSRTITFLREDAQTSQYEYPSLEHRDEPADHADDEQK